MNFHIVRRLIWYSSRRYFCGCTTNLTWFILCLDLQNKAIWFHSTRCHHSNSKHRARQKHGFFICKYVYWAACWLCCTCDTSCAWQSLLTSTTPWWIDVYCFFFSITKVMTITVAMTTPPTISPMMAPLFEPTSSAKNTCKRKIKEGG